MQLFMELLFSLDFMFIFQNGQESHGLLFTPKPGGFPINDGSYWLVQGNHCTTMAMTHNHVAAPNIQPYQLDGSDPWWFFCSPTSTPATKKMQKTWSRE